VLGKAMNAYVLLIPIFSGHKSPSQTVDFLSYLAIKSEQLEIINNWTESGKRKMLVKVKNFLAEGGFLEKNKDSYKIIKPIVDLAVIDEIKENGNKKILKIMFY